LLERLQKGNDEEAWDLFVASYRPLIVKYLTSIRLPSADVDDLIQECFAELVAHVGSFEHNGRTGAFRCWLRTIVLRRTQRILSKRTAVPLENEQLEELSGLDKSFEDFWNAEHDRHVIGQLLEFIRSEFTKTTWLAFQLHVVQGMSADETAERLGCTKNAVAISKSRVLRRLRQIGKGLMEW
jgi:RNA polymerase sigma-70 factor (ECF subfamily)